MIRNDSQNGPKITLPRARLDVEQIDEDKLSPRRERRSEAIFDAPTIVVVDPLSDDELQSLKGLESVFWKLQEGHPQFVSYLSEKEELEEDNRVKAFTQAGPGRKMTLARDASTAETARTLLHSTSLASHTGPPSSHINLSQYDAEGVAERRLEGSPLYDLLHMLVASGATEEFNLNCIFCHRCFPSFGLTPELDDPKARLTSLQFLELLLLRFLEPPQECEKEIREHYKINRSRIQGRIVRLLVTWVKCVSLDWSDKSCLLERHFRHFVANRIGEADSNNLQSVLTFIEKKKAEEALFNDLSRTNRRVNTDPDRTQNFLLDFWPENIAVEWSLIEAEIGKRVKPQHLLKTDWQRKDAASDHPIHHHLKWFNESTKWIQFQVLGGETSQERADIISHLITVGVFFRAMNNFSGLMQIYSGLDSPAISRLKQSWELVPEYLVKCHKLFGECMLPNQNYTRYRNAIHSALKNHQTAIPFFGMTLQDFTFYEEAPDMLETSGCSVPVINFSKMRSMSRELQKLFYCLYNSYDKVTNVLPQLIKEHFGSALEEFDTANIGKLIFKRGELVQEAEEFSMVSRSLPRRFLLESGQDFLLDLSVDGTLRLSYVREPSEREGMNDTKEDTSFERRKHGKVSQLSKSQTESESPRLFSPANDELQMDPRDWQLLRSISTLVEKNKGDVIIFEGQINETVFLVNKGTLSVIKQTKDNSQLLKQLVEGDCFGEISMLNQFATGISSASVIVESLTCSIYVVSGSLLAGLLESEPSFSKHFWGFLARTLADRTENYLHPNSLPFTPKAEKVKKKPVLKTESEVTFVFKNNPMERNVERRATIDGYHSTSEKGLIEIFDLPSDTVIVKEYFCTIKIKFIKMPGSFSLTHDFVCFYAKNLGGSKKKIIPFQRIDSIIMDSKKQKIQIKYGEGKKLGFIFLPHDLTEAESMMKGLWTNIKKNIRDYVAPRLERQAKVWVKAQTELDVLKRESISPSDRSVSKADSEIRLISEADWRILTDRRQCLKVYKKGENINFESDLDMFRLTKGKVKVIWEDTRESHIIAPEIFNENRFLVSLFKLRKLNKADFTVVSDEDNVEVVWMEYGFLKTLLVMDTTGLSGRFFKLLASSLARRLRTMERLKFNR